jgi:hypothetical protein
VGSLKNEAARCLREHIHAMLADLDDFEISEGEDSKPKDVTIPSSVTS